MKEATVEYKKLGHDSNKPRTKRGCTRRLCLFSVLIFFLAISASIFLFIGIGGSCFFPLHASCSVKWTMTASCTDVKSSLIKQIKVWNTSDNCKDGGERCLYKLVSEGSRQIKATHETPAKHYIDDLTFTFTQSEKTCFVQGRSSSQVWYALLDKGTNYCNLHNLVTGAGLDSLTGYMEETSNSICTQYSSADCNVY